MMRFRTAPWVTPLLTDAGVRRDTARFMRGIHRIASEMSTFLVPA